MTISAQSRLNLRSIGLVSKIRDLEWITVEEFLSKPKLHGKIKIEDFVSDFYYGAQGWLTTTFVLHLGEKPNSITCGAPVSKIWGEGKNIGKFIEKYKEKKVQAILYPLKDNFYYLRKLNVGPKSFKLINY